MINDFEIYERGLAHFFNKLKIATTFSESIWILTYILILVLGVTIGVSVTVWLE